MTKPQWGTKHLCQNCDARFYDMKKVPPVCPKCGTTAETENKTKARKLAPVVEEAPKVAKKTPSDPEVDDLDDDSDLDVDLDDDDDDDDDDSLIEDASDLGDDDDVVVVIKRDDDDKL